MPTAVAPRARALTMSAPLRMPESKSTGTGRRRQPRPQHRQAQFVGADSPAVEKREQRTHVTQVGPTGVRGAAALQRQVLVELLEDRGALVRHSPTVAGPAWRDSVDAPKRFRGEIFQRGITVDGHDQVGFGEQSTKHVHDAVDSAQRQTVGVGPADAHRGGA